MIDAISFKLTSNILIYLITVIKWIHYTPTHHRRNACSLAASWGMTGAAFPGMPRPGTPWLWRAGTGPSAPPCPRSTARSAPAGPAAGSAGYVRPGLPPALPPCPRQACGCRSSGTLGPRTCCRSARCGRAGRHTRGRSPWSTACT